MYALEESIVWAQLLVINISGIRKRAQWSFPLLKGLLWRLCQQLPMITSLSMQMHGGRAHEGSLAQAWGSEAHDLLSLEFDRSGGRKTMTTNPVLEESYAERVWPSRTVAYKYFYLVPRSSLWRQSVSKMAGIWGQCISQAMGEHNYKGQLSRRSVSFSGNILSWH